MIGQIAGFDLSGRRLSLMLLLLLTGCGLFRPTIPGSTVIRGKITGPDGSPLPNATVTVTRPFALMDIVGESVQYTRFVNSGTVVGTATSKSDGQYQVVVPGRETRGEILGTELPLVLVASPRDSGGRGPVVSNTLKPRNGFIDRDLQLWDPTVTISGEANPTIEWDPIPARATSHGVNADVNYHIYFDYLHSTLSRPPTAINWPFPDSTPRAEIDRRLLEDASGEFAVVADAGSFVFRSRLVAYQGTAGVPASRGASCIARGAAGALGRPSPCPITDGDFLSVLGGVTGPCPESTKDRHSCLEYPKWTSIELREDTQVALVALRGCLEDCTVETSRDGERWTEIPGERIDYGEGPDNDGLHISTRADRPVTARYVRVTSAAEDGLFSLREVSVWE